MEASNGTTNAALADVLDEPPPDVEMEKGNSRRDNDQSAAGDVAEELHKEQQARVQAEADAEDTSRRLLVATEQLAEYAGNVKGPMRVHACAQLLQNLSQIELYAHARKQARRRVLQSQMFWLLSDKHHIVPLVDAKHEETKRLNDDALNLDDLVKTLTAQSCASAEVRSRFRPKQYTKRLLINPYTSAGTTIAAQSVRDVCTKC
jgi:hypothetical protein